MTLDVFAVPVSALEAFIPLVLPLEGRLSGNVELSGTMDSMTVVSRVDLLEPNMGPTSGEIDGVFHLRRPLGVTGLTARLIPLDLALVNRFAEGLLLDGSVSLDIRAAGWLDTGMRVVAVATYPDPLSEASNVSLQGTITEVDGEIQVSFDGELSPLSMAGIFGEESPLSRLGLARGTFLAEGASVGLRAPERSDDRGRPPYPGEQLRRPVATGLLPDPRRSLRLRCRGDRPSAPGGHRAVRIVRALRCGVAT